MGRRRTVSPSQSEKGVPIPHTPHPNSSSLSPSPLSLPSFSRHLSQYQFPTVCFLYFIYSSSLFSCRYSSCHFLPPPHTYVILPLFLLFHSLQFSHSITPSLMQPSLPPISFLLLLHQSPPPQPPCPCFPLSPPTFLSNTSLPMPLPSSPSSTLLLHNPGPYVSLPHPYIIPLAAAPSVTLTSSTSLPRAPLLLPPSFVSPISATTKNFLAISPNFYLDTISLQLNAPNGYERLTHACLSLTVNSVSLFICQSVSFYPSRSFSSPLFPSLSSPAFVLFL